MPRRQVDPPAGSSQLYELKVTLRDSRPPIWRRLRVLGDTALHSLHQIIQDAMGWTNSHLYHVTVDGRRYSERRPDGDLFGEPPMDARRIRLQDFRLGEGDRFTYLYDFGDGWQHTVKVEGIAATELWKTYPRLLTAQRRCPPEDVGGPWGYAKYLEAMGDANHERHEEMIAWRGPDFVPQIVDVAMIEKEFTKLIKRGSRRKTKSPRVKSD